MRRVLPALLALAAAAAAGSLTATPAGAAAAAADDGARRGAEAVRSLGDRLPAVARAYGTDAATLRQRFATDDALWVDRQDKLFYVDPAPRDQAEPSAARPSGAKPSGAKPGGGGGSGSTYQEPTGWPFDLHSRPGSQRTIYLDFTGHGGIYGGSIGGAWPKSYTGGDGVAEPYSEDADLSFSETEKAHIAQVFELVAEDFAPFDVDVTTQKPSTEDAITRSSTSDQTYGTRVAMTSTATGCGCGGVAYVGVFDHAGTGRGGHAWYQPAFVYNEGVKAAAEAASHEAGHNLGLSHDGTVAHDGVAAKGYYEGHGDWAPIMGVGYYRPLVQWSKGEYAHADNPEDDFVVMAANGAARGDDLSSLTAVDASPVTGILEKDTDTDVFTVTVPAGQTASVLVAPTASSPNLDTAATLVSGTTTLESSDATRLDAGFTGVPAGTWTLSVRGTGTGNPLTDGYSSYGSLGAYRVSVVLTAG